MAFDRPTVKLTEDEVESLVEAERRYRPEEDEKLCADVAVVAAEHEPDVEDDVGKGRPRKRTVRMRVFNFRPLARPHDEYSHKR